MQVSHLKLHVLRCASIEMGGQSLISLSENSLEVTIMHSGNEKIASTSSLFLLQPCG